MSFEKHLREKDVELTEDGTLPKGERTLKMFKRVIAAVRSAEAASNDAERDANERCRQAQSQVIELTTRLHKVEAELMHMKLERTLESEPFELIQPAGRSQLLELASV